MLEIIKRTVWALLLVALTSWSVLAIYFGDSRTASAQTCLALAVGLFGLAAAIAQCIGHWRKFVLAVTSFLFLVVISWWLTIQPSNDRSWQPDLTILPYAEVNGDKVTVYNIRNFDYQAEFDFTPAYYDKTYDLTKLEGVDLFAVYWMGPAIAHTILSFNFGENGHLAVSIEARKDLNEGYSSIKGFFRQYELTYIVADERDVIRLRTNYRNNPPEAVYLYRLYVKKDNIRRLFMEYIRRINELRVTPAFYNTLFDNCTTAIWFNTRVNPGYLPFSWKILLSGYVPEYLYESNYLNKKETFEALRQKAHVNAVAQSANQSPDFSLLIRAGKEKPTLE